MPENIKGGRQTQMSIKDKILLCGKTDAGLLRDHNEDSIGCNENIALAVLADGMGGHRGGEMASAMTVSTILESITAKAIKNSTVSRLMHKAIMQANKRIYDSSKTNPQYRGMGTTVVAVIFYDNHFTVAHVGDSRLYRLRNNQLEQITRDHSFVQEQIDLGLHTAEQARKSPHKNLITRAIGIDDDVQVDIQEDIAMPDDIYLLCSDGVNDMLEDEVIKNILINNSCDLEKASSEIIRLANEYGGKDNISALLAKPVKAFPVKMGLLTRFRSILS
jgi:serine/threonine protein phosphatase PrpC